MLINFAGRLCECRLAGGGGRRRRRRRGRRRVDLSLDLNEPNRRNKVKLNRRAAHFRQGSPRTPPGATLAPSGRRKCNCRPSGGARTVK